MEEKKKNINEKSTKNIREVKTKKQKISKSVIFLFIAIFAFALYSAITIVSQHAQISEKRAELAALQEELQIVDIENEYLEEVKNYTGDDLEKFIEDKAREDLDYVKNGERVFVNVSGN